MVADWIITSGLPWTTIEDFRLKDAFLSANPQATLPSARTLVRSVEDLYSVVEKKVDQLFQSSNSTIHFTHDAWTDSAGKNSFFGIYGSFIDDKFQYREVLMRLLHMRGKHTGARMGDGLFALFNNDMKISHNIGPGTGDNASNNKSAADRLSTLLLSDLAIDQSGSDIVGCVCHIANLAALDYIAGEGQSIFDFICARNSRD